MLFRRHWRSVTVVSILAGSFLHVSAFACVKNIDAVRIAIFRHNASKATVVVKGYCTMILDEDMPCVCGVSARQTDTCCTGVTSAVIRDVVTGEIVRGFDFEASEVAAQYFNEAFATNNWNAFFSKTGPITDAQGRLVTVDFEVDLDPTCGAAELVDGLQGGRIGTDGADETGRGANDHFEVLAPSEVAVVPPTSVESVAWNRVKRMYRD